MKVFGPCPNMGFSKIISKELFHIRILPKAESFFKRNNPTISIVNMKNMYL